MSKLVSVFHDLIYCHVHSPSTTGRVADFRYLVLHNLRKTYAWGFECRSWCYGSSNDVVAERTLGWFAPKTSMAQVPTLGC